MPAPILILFATETGNAEYVAGRVAGAARTRGYEPRVWNVDGLDLGALSVEPRVLVVASTFGEGDPPTSAENFWNELQALPAGALTGMNYSVYALGDHSYEHFCGFGVRVDEALAAAGANRLVERSDNDLDYEAGLEPWLRAVFASMETVPVAN